MIVFKNALKKYAIKIVLYSILAMFVLATLTWMLHGGGSLSENFFAGAIEILVTVCLIDGLLSIDRHRRMSALNRGQSNGIKTLMSLRIIGLTNAFGFKYSNDIEIASYTNTQMREYVGVFLEDARYKKFLKDLQDMDESLRQTLKDLEERMIRELSSIRKSLDDVKPYADPEIARWINEFQPKAIAQFSMVNHMYEAIYEYLPKKGHKDPKKEKDFWPFFKDHMFHDLVITGEGSANKESFKTIITGTLSLFLDIHESAERNKLHYDI